MSEITEATDSLLQARQQARLSSAVALDDNPDDAARAQQLSLQTGVPATVIHGDLESFERTYKGALNRTLIDNSPHLRDYVNSNPMAAKVSHDDFHNLDEAAELVKQLQPGRIGGIFAKTDEEIKQKREEFEAFLEGSGKLRLPWHQPEWYRPEDKEFAGKHPFLSQLVSQGSWGLETALKGLSGFGHMIPAVFKNKLTSMGMAEDDAHRYANTLGGFIEWRLTDMAAHGISPHGEIGAGRLEREAMRDKYTGELEKLAEAVHAAKPYLESGTPVPYGIHEVFDKAIEGVSKEEIKQLDDATRASAKTNTRERSPELYADFVRQIVGNRKIEIDAEAVRKLYGEDIPEPDDGKLSWIPNLRQQLEAAEVHGGSIEAPLADWYANIEPEIWKALKEDVRTNPHGVTLNEIEKSKERKEVEAKRREEAFEPEVEPPPEDAVQAARRVAGVERSVFEGPLFADMAAPEQIKLLRESEHPEFGTLYNIAGESGKGYGQIEILDHGKSVEVVGIKSPQGAGSLGPSTVREILKQVRELYPEAETVTGFRISGARALAHTERDAQVALRGEGWDKAEAQGDKWFPLLPETAELGGEVSHNIGTGEITVPRIAGTKLADLLDKVHFEFLDEGTKLLNEFFGNRLKELVGDTPVHIVSEADMAKLLESKGRTAPGFYGPREGQVVLTEDMVNGNYPPWYTSRVIIHEAEHALSSTALLKYPVLDAVVRQVMRDADEHIASKDPKARKAFDYAFQNSREFFADVKSRPALQKWLAQAPASKETIANVKKIADALGLKDRIVSTWDAIRVIFKDLYNRMFGRVPDNSVLDQVFRLSDILENVNQTLEKMATEQGISKGDLLLRAESPDLADKPMFGKMAIGMNKRWQEKYFKLIEKRNAEDMEKQFKDAERDERKRQTEEWKSNAAKMYSEVRNDIEGRPDIAVGTFFESGTLFGQRVAEKPILDTTKLSPEQKALLPKTTYGRGGINPDDLAGAFGLRSGDELVQVLAGIQRARGDVPFKEFVRDITQKEVSRRMLRDYGDIEENIMNEAIEHVIGSTQMDILHEELVGLGMRLGRELPFTKDDTRAMARTKFDSTPVGQITVEKMLRDAGKAGTDAELALLDNKPDEAFQAKQKQYLAMRMAEEAKRFEKEQRRFDKLMKQFSAREVKSVLPEYTNFIHQIMGQIGRPVRRSVQDLQEAIAQSGYRDLEHFVQEKENSLREVPVAEFLFDQNFRKQTEDMSVGEFRAVINSIKALVHNGRDEMKIIREGEARDLEEVLTEMKGKLEDLGKDKAPRIDRPLSQPIRTVKTYWASSLTTESILNRWDKDDPKGIFNRFITYPMAEAANHEARLIREFQQHLREAVGDIPDIDKLITNDLFKDPLTGDFFTMRKRNILGILQNIGNKSNLEKLAKGYGLEEMEVVRWVIAHTTKEDWDRAQRIGDVFGRLSDMADNMAYNLSGVTFEKIPIESLETPYGRYRGWYNPIKYDPNRPGRSKRLIGPNALEEEGYFRAATPQGYTKGRTGYIAPVELNLDVVPMRIKQMIHDIAFRPAIIQTSKVFYDSGFQRAVVRNYGEVYAKQLVPYLKDVANFANSMSDAAHTGNRAIEFFRQNLIGTLIGFNPHTVAKHGMTAAMNSLTEVGPINFMRELAGLMMNSEEAGKTNWRFAMEHSEELQRRMRNWSELIQGQPELSLMGASPRQFMIAAGSTPVAVGDLLSAVPTWLAQYKQTLEGGADHGQAVAEGNRAVRRAHGSSAITNRAQIMRSNALGATFSSLYGFFSHMLNKQFELSWKAADSFQGLKAGDLTEAKRHTPALLMGLISYVIFPAVVEELVTPYTNADRDSWGVKAVKVLAKGYSSSFIGARDFVDGLINTREGGAGLIPTAFKSLYDIARDLSKGPKSLNREQAGKTIKHTFTAVGTLSGLTNAQEGRTAEFIYRYNQGLEHPKGPWDWMRGMTRGTLKEHRR